MKLTGEQIKSRGIHIRSGGNEGLSKEPLECDHHGITIFMTGRQ